MKQMTLKQFEKHRGRRYELTDLLHIYEWAQTLDVEEQDAIEEAGGIVNEDQIMDLIWQVVKRDRIKVNDPTWDLFEDNDVKEHVYGVPIIIRGRTYWCDPTWAHAFPGEEFCAVDGRGKHWFYCTDGISFCIEDNSTGEYL